MGDNYYDSRYQQSPRDPYAQSTYTQQVRADSDFLASDVVMLTMQQAGYNTYQPPAEEGYRSSPAPQNLQVAQYDDGRRRRSGEYGSRPRSRHGDSYYDEDRYSDRGRLEPPSPNSYRPSSRGSHREREREREREHKEHRNSEVKSIGATILGGVAGALIGRKAGHKDILPTVLGGVAGAWGGHKIEEGFAERKHKHHDRELVHEHRGRESRRGSEYSDEEPKGFREKIKQGIRSLSRKRTDDGERSRSSRRRRDGSADSDSSRRSRRRSQRYEDDRYDEDRRDRDRDRERYY